jgi:hypothetical protein
VERRLVPDRVLTLRELNRATLARQLLLERGDLSATGAIERLVGLQAQVANPPYIGLWTRLSGFRREELTGLLERREVFRATFVRSTLHLVSADDYLTLRPVIQPALTRALYAFFGRRARRLDVDRIVAAAKPWFEEPRTFAELRARLSELEPDEDPEAMAYAVRTRLPLVQVPPAGTWGSGGNPAYTLVEPDRMLSPEEGLRRLVFRYLAAFGPASVKDLQAWSGLVRLKKPLAEIRAELRAFRDESGNELLDLPDVPWPDPDIPAPPRFLPEYDNLVLSHADRRRVVPEEYRAGIFLSAGRVRATFLTGGLVRGTWKVERSGDAAALVVEPFAPLSRGESDALAEEGERLVRFIRDAAERYEVRFAEV